MVDPISSTGPVSTLLRAQSSATISANTQQLTQKFFDQVTNGARPTAVQPSEKTAGASGSKLPRGSLVDMVA